MSFLAIYKGILVVSAFKGFGLDLPKDIELQILHFMHHTAADTIIKFWYRYVDNKTKLTKRVISWLSNLNDFSPADVLGPQFIEVRAQLPWDDTYKLLCDCNRYLSVVIDNNEWWKNNFAKMFKQLLDFRTIVSGLPAQMPRRRRKLKKIINERLEKTLHQLDIYNKIQYEHTGYTWYLRGWVKLKWDSFGRDALRLRLFKEADLYLGQVCRA